jgi:hypothetical protein
VQYNSSTTPLTKPERQELPKVPITPSRKITEHVERFFQGFFSRKDCKVSTEQLKDTRNTSECCLMCDNKKGKVDACV